MMEPGFPQPRVSPCQQQQQEEREEGSCSSPPLSRGSGAVVESPLLDPLLFHQDKAKRRLDTHVQRKGLQLLWGLPRLVQCSLEQSVPALPGFLACTTLHGATDPQRPLFKAERQQGLEHHLREKKMHCKWGLPKRIKRALQPPQSLGTSSAAKADPGEIEPLPSDAIPGTEAATKEPSPLAPGGPFHLATAREPPEALLRVEREPLSRGFPQKKWWWWWQSSSSSLDLWCLSPPPTSHQAAAHLFDAIQSTPEEKELSRLTPQEWEQKVSPLHGSTSWISCKASSFQSLPLRRSPAISMENPLQELKVSPQRVSELPGSQGQRLKASQGDAPRTTLALAEMRASRAPERGSVAFYPEESSIFGSSEPQDPLSDQMAEKGAEEGRLSGTSAKAFARDWGRVSGAALLPHPGGRDQGPLHPESPGLGGPLSRTLSQEGLWCLQPKRSPEEDFLGLNLAWIGSRAAAKWEGSLSHQEVGKPPTHSGPEPGRKSNPTKACHLNQWLARKTSSNLTPCASASAALENP